MIYTSSIRTEKLGDDGSTRFVVLKVSKGLIYRVEVDFPPGCCGLLDCRIFDGGYQVWPSNRDDSFHGDASVIAFDDCYLKTAAPYEFRIETKNNDDTWAHTIQVRLGIVSSEAFMSRYMPSTSWEKFQEVMAQAVIEQDILRSEQLAETLKVITGK